MGRTQDQLLPDSAKAYVDFTTFEQIVSMDAGDDFAKEIVYGYLQQGYSTIEKMEAAIEARDFDEITNASEFLSKSAATLGFFQVRDRCMTIHNYGQKKSSENDKPDSKSDGDIWLRRIAVAVRRLKEDQNDVDRIMKDLFHRDSDDDD